VIFEPAVGWISSEAGASAKTALHREEFHFECLRNSSSAALWLTTQAVGSGKNESAGFRSRFAADFMSA
jgi:hypothetical protein